MASVHVALAKVAKTAMGAVVPIAESVPRLSALVDLDTDDTAEMDGLIGEVWLVIAIAEPAFWTAGAEGGLDALESPNHYLVADLPYAFSVKVRGERFNVKAVA